MALATADELRTWLRLPTEDFDTAAAELYLDSAEQVVRRHVGTALDALNEASATPTETDLWREARFVVLEHAAHTLPNPEGAMQKRIDQVGSTSHADSRHATRDLTKGQEERLKAAAGRSGLQSLALS